MIVHNAKQVARSIVLPCVHPLSKVTGGVLRVIAAWGFLASVCLLTLSGCGNVSQGVAKDGSGAQHFVWPDPSSATPMHRGGTYPDPAQLQMLRYGMNKQQIANLIGFPHFDEGVWRVREWNYVFNFREAGSNNIQVCQFKVLFDDNKVAHSFYWHPESCAHYMAVSVSPTTAQAPEQQAALPTDTLFSFDRSSVNDITDNGRTLLDQLARDIAAEKDRIDEIHVRGYSDRLGGDSYDFVLSERRAYTVMRYLAERGVPQDLMVAEGRGKSDAIKNCPPSPMTVLIACLAPNRRVEVQIHTRPPSP